MAIYSTFFLSAPDQLHPGFPEWRLPLPQPVTRKTINPFTREDMTIQTRAPEWDDVDPNDPLFPEMAVVAIEGDYQAYLERRLPPFIQSQPHWCSKGLTLVELDPLIGIVTGIDETRLETPLYAHPSLGSGIDQFPNDFLEHLTAADEAAITAIAEKWAATMSTPEYTHSIDGNRLSEGWTVEDASGILSNIAELARRQEAGQSMYLLTEA